MSEFHIHDTGYKYLFSHAELVQELVEGFLPTELCAMLDFTTLSLVSGSYITPSMKHKEDDAVWRVQMGDKFVYFYLLLEFQSTVEETMPIRMMQYVASLYESLEPKKPTRNNYPLLFLSCFTMARNAGKSLQTLIN
ncbi:MAG: Rpn family recombination-promoting nuclease/putative transposase [Gammaproteobacteria bacterium]|nr:Rpn family recombination-promoting nuclease/putative transposase [Gammaproteobacteria bacterium]